MNLKYRKLGRLPRTKPSNLQNFRPILDKYSGRIPNVLDYSAGLPTDLGALGNDVLSDCTCAAIFHGKQVWHWQVTKQLYLPPTTEVVDLYSHACGYVPGKPDTDKGGSEVEVLRWLAMHPLPGEKTINLVKAIEVDYARQYDIIAALFLTGGLYVGINIPANIMPPNANPPKIWRLTKVDQPILGGHSVWCCGYNSKGVLCMSWGEFYLMTWDFFTTYTEESYAIVNRDWLACTGQAPNHLTEAQIETALADF
jgi:hypothetical protein